ncbi:MAG TPA: hypothetical protein VF482_01885 [Trebonia sp.]
MWCSPDPAEANAAADRYAAYRACSRPSMSSGLATTFGRPVRSERMPSAANAALIGSAFGAHIASTQCASAFSPDATLISTGREVVSAAS